MPAHEQRCPSPVRVMSVTLGVILATLVTAAPASATEVGAQRAGGYSNSATVTVAPPTPQLSIAVDNGRTSAAVGDTPTYTITVRNLGTTQVTGLLVTQSVPTGLKVRSADSTGVAKAGMVSWRLDLEASGKVTVHTAMTVAKTPKDLLRLATVACASVSDKGPPIVCATDSDQLPAGASAQVSKASAAPASGPPVATSKGRDWAYAAGGLGGIVLLMGVLIARRRKDR
jgi:uncharacterized repeat protein (TIGR01451 family)